MTTSLTNTFLNKMMLLFSLRVNNIPEEHFDFIVEGDDNVIVLDDQYDAAAVFNIINKLGFG